jgi:hypothetical protein
MIAGVRLFGVACALGGSGITLIVVQRPGVLGFIELAAAIVVNIEAAYRAHRAGAAKPPGKKPRSTA